MQSESKRRHLLVSLLFLLSLSLLVFRDRLIATVLLGGTYIVFPFLRSPILGDHDGFNLAHVRAAPNATEVVPRIIHQVRLGPGFAMRPSWEVARNSCVELHPDWEFRLWTDKTGDAFVREYYGEEMFALYRGYEQEIMRSNVLRYLVLHTFGGIYMDLDLACRVPLDPFLTQSFVTPPAQPTGVNNAFIVAKPHHPFFQHVVHHLSRFNLGWFGSAYITNMFKTGCHFFSTMHATFPRHNELKVLPWEYRLNGHVTTPLFEHLGASSWHRNDAKLILQMGKSIEFLKPYFALLAPLSLLVLAAATFAVIARRQRMRHRRRRSWRGDVEWSSSSSRSPVSPSKESMSEKMW